MDEKQEKSNKPEENAPVESQSKPLAEWSFPEFIKYDRSRNWYIIAGIIIAASLVYSVWTANFPFALIILMVVVVYYMHFVRTPEEVQFAIFDNGLQVGHRIIKWRELKNFWILYDPPEVKKLYFSFKSSIRPYLSIPLAKQNPVELRKTLAKYLEEDLEQEEEPASEQWGKILKL